MLTLVCKQRKLLKRINEKKHGNPPISSQNGTVACTYHFRLDAELVLACFVLYTSFP